MTPGKPAAKTKQPTNNGVRSARLYKAAARSRITNGSSILPNVDNRTFWVRRYRDLYALLLSDQGGDEHVSEAHKILTRKAACICVELERREMVMAQAGRASDNQIEVYQRSANTLRRLLQALSPSLGRVARDVGPTLQEYLARRDQHLGDDDEQADDAEVIDASAS